MSTPIIIVNWNGYDDTIHCVESLLQSRHQDFSIFLVDNGSEDGEGTRLMRKFVHNDKVNVIVLDENLGFAKANNLILERICKEHGNGFVALLNNDTEVDADWLGSILQCAIAKEWDIVSSQMLNYYHRNRIDNLGHQMLTTGEIVPIAHGLEVPQPGKHLNFGACAGAGLYRISMLKQIGLFDSYFSTGYEDAELGMRAVVMGYKAGYCPKAIIYHKMGQSIKKVFNEEYSLMIQRGIWYSFFKNMTWSVIILSLPLIFAKNVILTIVNIFFLRWKYLRVQWRAFYWFFKEDLSWALGKRDPRKKLSAIQIFNRQSFFLWFDIKRFYAIFLRGDKSALDEYGAG